MTTLDFSQTLKTYPHPVGFEKITSMTAIARHYPRGYLDLFRKYGDVAAITLPFKGVFFFQPDDIQMILKERPQNFRKSLQYEELKDLLGDGLVSTEGEHWLKQRKASAPSFKPGRILKTVDLMVRHAVALADRWADAAKANTLREVNEDFSDIALGILGEALMGRPLNADGKILGNALMDCLDYSIKRIVYPVKLPKWVPTPGQRRFRRGLQVIDAICESLVHSVKTEANPGLLADIYHGTNVDSPAGHQELIQQIKTFVLAGHETTALSLAWTIHALENRPDVQQKIADEVTAVLNGRTPSELTQHDVRNLNYTRRVFQESMRLYPPVPTVSKQPLVDENINGHPVPAGTNIIIAPYVIHRHPDFWDNPEEFQPDRFESTPKPFSYLPFLYGPRSCIGEHFAMFEGVTILGILCHRVKMIPVGPDRVREVPMATLRMAGKLQRRFELREQQD